MLNFHLELCSIMMVGGFISECASHCSLCYNETECYECRQGFFLTENGECQRTYQAIYIHMTCTFVNNNTEFLRIKMVFISIIIILISSYI